MLWEKIWYETGVTPTMPLSERTGRCYSLLERHGGKPLYHLEDKSKVVHKFGYSDKPAVALAAAGVNADFTP